MPAWHHASDVLPFLAARGQALCFWSEQWLSRETLLTGVVDRLRSTRVATALEVDAAWHRVRDVSLQLGRWGRLDTQMLVEEHERGRVLVRIARRLRVTPFFGASAMCLLALALLLGTTMSTTWAVSTVGVMIALVLRLAWQAAATIALADGVMTRVMFDAGAIPLGEPAESVAARVTTWRPGSVPAGPLNQPSTRHAL